MKAKVIRFDDENFIKLYKSPATIDRRGNLTFKALEIYEQVKNKRIENEQREKTRGEVDER